MNLEVVKDASTGHGIEAVVLYLSEGMDHEIYISYDWVLLDRCSLLFPSPILERCALVGPGGWSSAAPIIGYHDPPCDYCPNQQADVKERIARAVRMVFAAERLDLALFEEKCTPLGGHHRLWRDALD